jgi:hypothetical protein
VFGPEGVIRRVVVDASQGYFRSKYFGDVIETIKSGISKRMKMVLTARDLRSI